MYWSHCLTTELHDSPDELVQYICTTRHNTTEKEPDEYRLLHLMNSLFEQNESNEIYTLLVQK